jgi:hypothetical protein
VSAPLIYVAGAIDYTDNSDHAASAPAHCDLWPEGAEVFCPKCENDGETVEGAVLHKNFEAITNADLVVAFMSTAVLSVGTPIEVWEKAAFFPERVLLVHESENGSLGLFARWWQSEGVEIINVLASDGLKSQTIMDEVRLRVARKLIQL